MNVRTISISYTRFDDPVQTIKTDTARQRGQTVQPPVQAPVQKTMQTVTRRQKLQQRRTHRTAQLRAGKQLAHAAIAGRGWTHTHRLERQDDRWHVVAPPTHPSLWISISHSGPWVVCAHDSKAPCGIDVECITRDIDVDYACAHFLHPHTGASLETLPKEDKKRVFLMLWTLLEAQGKRVDTPLVQTLKSSITDDDRLRSLPEETRAYTFLGRWLDATHFACVNCVQTHASSLVSQGWRHLDGISTLRDMTPSTNGIGRGV